MAKIYDYCCKKCWHTWRNINVIKVCPKCKSTDLDVDFDVTISD
jgi:predicted Zn-ribbon and HTH transcriptional regulator